MNADPNQGPSLDYLMGDFLKQEFTGKFMSESLLRPSWTLRHLKKLTRPLGRYAPPKIDTLILLKNTKKHEISCCISVLINIAKRDIWACVARLDISKCGCRGFCVLRFWQTERLPDKTGWDFDKPISENLSYALAIGFGPNRVLDLFQTVAGRTDPEKSMILSYSHIPTTDWDCESTFLRVCENDWPEWFWTRKCHIFLLKTDILIKMAKNSIPRDGPDLRILRPIFIIFAHFETNVGQKHKSCQTRGSPALGIVAYTGFGQICVIFV